MKSLRIIFALAILNFLSVAEAAVKKDFCSQILNRFQIKISQKIALTDRIINSVTPRKSGALASKRKELRDYLETLDDLHLRSIKIPILQKRIDSIQTVLYPLSGFDALYPLKLFRNAKTFIAIDKRPFLFGSQKNSMSIAKPYGQEDHMFFDDVRGEMGPKILGNIFEAYPLAKIIEIHSFVVRKNICGWIRFLDDNGTQKTYIYISDTFKKTKHLNKYWWAGLIPNSDWALVKKAAMEFASEAQVAEDLDEILLKSPRALLATPSIDSPWFAETHHLRAYRFKDIKLGYRELGVRQIFEFIPIN